MNVAKITALMMVATALAGCAFPAAAPTVMDMERPRDEVWDFYIVQANANTVGLLSNYREDGLPGSFARRGYRANAALRPGDVIAISVYETGGPSLFGNGANVAAPAPIAPAPGAPASSAALQQSQTTTLPPQVIEPSGRILVPFVGEVSVRGLTPVQAARKIEEKLAGKSVQPQVIVSLVGNGATASVSGEANRAGPVPLTSRGERLLDAVAYAGGAKYPATEIDVRIQRGQTTGAVSLQREINDPSQNIHLQPGDQVVLIRNPKTFTVLGAAQKVSQYTFDTQKVTLAEAVGRAGGPIDTIGNPAGIYLMRTEPASVARAVLELNPNTAIDARTGKPVLMRQVEGPTRIAYRINMNEAGGYFIAQSVQMRDKDIVLVTNAEAAQLIKYMTVIRGFTGVAYDLAKSGK